MEIPDGVLRADLTASCPLQIRQGLGRHSQAFQFLLGNRVGDSTQVTLDLLLGK